jgi:ankyrin repeat protein
MINVPNPSSSACKTPMSSSAATLASTENNKSFSPLMLTKKVTIQDLLEEIANYESSHSEENSSRISQNPNDETDYWNSSEETSNAIAEPILHQNNFPLSAQRSFSSAAAAPVSPQKRKVGRPPKSSFLKMESFQAYLNACQEGNLEQVEFLAKRGINCALVYKNTGQEPILLAAKRGHFELFCLLLRQYDIYRENLVSLLGQLADSYRLSESISEAIQMICNLLLGGNPLFISCLFNQHEQLHKLLKTSAQDIKVIEELIDVSCKFSAKECLKILLNCQEKLRQNPEIEQINFLSSSSGEETFEPKEETPVRRKRGRPPKNPKQVAFFEACREGDLETLKLFPDSEYSLTAYSTDGLNALHIAANRGNVALVEFLLNKNDLDIYPNLPSKRHGNTALHFAARKGFPEVVCKLLQFGADKNVKNDSNRTAYELSSNVKVLQLLAPSKQKESPIELSENALPSSQEEKKRPNIPYDGNLYLLSFPNSKNSLFFLLRQTNQIMKRLGGLRKYTYRALPNILATQEQYKLLQSNPLTHKIISSLTKEAVYLMEYRTFVNFFAAEYTHRITDITLPILRIDFSSALNSKANQAINQMQLNIQEDNCEDMPPPKLARKFTPRSE